MLTHSNVHELSLNIINFYANRIENSLFIQHLLFMRFRKIVSLYTQSIDKTVDINYTTIFQILLKVRSL